MKFSLKENTAVTVNGKRYVSKNGVIDVYDRDGIIELKDSFKLREIKKEVKKYNG